MRRHWAVLWILLSWTASGQLRPGQRVDLLKSESVTVQRTSQGPVTILRGDVALRNREGTFYCDSARWWRKDDRFLAYGHIRYRGKQGVRLSSSTLDYSQGVAFLRGQVVLEHEGQVLRTPSLRYDTELEQGTFQQGGDIESPDGRLTCRSGKYFAKEEHFMYEGTVHAVTEDYILDAPAMEQWPSQHRFTIPRGGQAKTESGWMTFGAAQIWTNPKMSQFYRGVEGQDSTIQFRADSLYQVDALKRTELFGRLSRAQWADWSEDSLEIHAYTIVRTPDSARAHGEVHTFSQGLVSASESMRWQIEDSLMTLRGNPLVWAEDYIVRADTLRFYMHVRPDMDSLFGRGLVHVGTPVDSVRFDEMAGSTMAGWIAARQMKRVTLRGNAQALFHPDAERVSHIQCAQIALEFEKGKLDQVQFIQGPQGDVQGPLSAQGEHLPGFQARSDQRPARMAAISGLK